MRALSLLDTLRLRAVFDNNNNNKRPHTEIIRWFFFHCFLHFQIPKLYEREREKKKKLPTRIAALVLLLKLLRGRFVLSKNACCYFFRVGRRAFDQFWK